MDLLLFFRIIWYNGVMKELTVDLAYTELQQILRDKVLLVVGTGASMALDPRFGMGALGEELLEKIPGLIKKDDEAKDQWKEVEKILKVDNLENALTEVSSEFLKKIIIQITGEFLVELDKQYKLSILNNEKKLPITLFIQKLFRGLSENDPVLDIMTPNYDLLIEHGCDQRKIPYINGFCGGIKKYEDWKEAEKQMIYTSKVTVRKKSKKVERTKKHIRLYKVHGSINCFIIEDKIIEDNSLVYFKCDVDSSIERLIITPGNLKYKEAFEKTFECFTEANKAIEGERAFVFVGYGFNDNHIHKKIVKELLVNEKPGIIVTKELSENAEKFLEKSVRLWAVYHNSKNHDNVSENDTLIYNKEYNKPLIIKGQSLWNIQDFSRVVLGDENGNF